ncbi:glycosyltransferase family 4 protein [Phaeodactylibacter xiamenensis]|uniref:glycosyltransferase family 4 protein n=1 Tax=Phaeodactylibacter xiamenensis TaxID=1524460 RepID=UPI0024A7D8BC|nr:glycosyltransferase family 4 protein [Phaeodactylibacter xiamenensis]
MKILIFYQYFGTPKGGWSTRVYELTKRWVAEGHGVTVVTSPYYKSDIKVDQFITRKKIDGINLIIINAPDSNKDHTLKRAFNALLFAVTASILVLRIKSDICISSSGPITVAIPGLLAKWVRKIPLVFEVRDLWPRGGIELGKIKSKFIARLALSFEKLIYKNSALVVACSPGMQVGVNLVNPVVPTLVIPNASDPELFAENSGSPSSPVYSKIQHKHIFLYAGSLGLMDDCSQAVKAMQYVKDKPIALVFAGDGAERQSLEQSANETGHQDIYFLGLLPKTEVAKWFSVATASIITFKDIPVLHTSSPNKMFDSFAAGVPIIQTTKGWIKELVDRTQCGLNANPNDPQTIAAAMQLLIDSPDLQSEMQLAARQLAANDFNRARLAKAYLDHISSLV